MKRKTLRSAADLAEAGLISSDTADGIRSVESRYAIAVPPLVADLINPDDANDPVARQYIPDERELVVARGERNDPIGDEPHSPVEGIVHRYRDRVLFKVVHTCPVYCRFCFRREMVGPGKNANLTPEAITRAIAYVADHPEIREVILTGGDPFILAPHRIARLTASIDEIPHVERIRWHTRVPVVEPDRVDSALVEALRPRRARPVVAVHANHPREFTAQAIDALQRLSGAGISLLSQSVLLKGVNDDASTLSDLVTAFLRHGVEPYYLHHADLARGTSHFRTSIREGINLMTALRDRMPGAHLPTYVLDLPGGFSKVNLESENAIETHPGRWRLLDEAGRWHDYEG